jgi:hypothetical protein
MVLDQHPSAIYDEVVTRSDPSHIYEIKGE